MGRNLVLKLLVFFAGLSLVLSSCDERRVYEKNIDLPANVWNKDSLLTFPVDITDANTDYNIYYNIRNDRSYGAQNIYLQITIADTLGRTLNTDLNNIELFDPKSGEPYGKGLDVLDHQVPVFTNYRFPRADRYNITVQHKMRDEAGGTLIAKDGNLENIVAVGVRVERAANLEK
jgi:gliding motility-associated lipoprotein GldH